MGTPQYGLHRDVSNSRVALNYAGTRRLHVNATGAAINGTFSSTGALTVDADGLTVTAGGITVTAGGLTVTAGGLTVTAGGAVITAGDAAITAGNVRLGAIETFATTEPTSAVVMKSGTAPAGAITTSGGIFSSDTVVRKIIAAGTVSNVEA